MYAGDTKQLLSILWASIIDMSICSRFNGKRYRCCIDMLALMLVSFTSVCPWVLKSALITNNSQIIWYQYDVYAHSRNGVPICLNPNQHQAKKYELKRIGTVLRCSFCVLAGSIIYSYIGYTISTYHVHTGTGIDPCPYKYSIIVITILNTRVYEHALAFSFIFVKIRACTVLNASTPMLIR